MRLFLPSGSKPPVRGDDKEIGAGGSAVSTSSLPTPALDQLLGGSEPRLPSSSSSSSSSSSPSSLGTSLVKHDEHIARVTSQAYSELDRLSEIAAVIAKETTPTSVNIPTSASLDPHHPTLIIPPHAKTRSRTALMTAAATSPSTSSMFIKPRGNKAKKASRGLELQSALDRNRNLLKSREVCRLLSPTQLEKLKQDTADLEILHREAERQKEEKQRDRPLEEAMLGLRMADYRPREAGSRVSTQMLRGKARLISQEDNARLQRANFEAEREMQRTRECELMGKQMGKISLSSSSSSSARGAESDRMTAIDADREAEEEGNDNDDDDAYDGEDRYSQDMV